MLMTLKIANSTLPPLVFSCFGCYPTPLPFFCIQLLLVSKYVRAFSQAVVCWEITQNRSLAKFILIFLERFAGALADEIGERK